MISRSSWSIRALKLASTTGSLATSSAFAATSSSMLLALPVVALFALLRRCHS